MKNELPTHLYRYRDASTCYFEEEIKKAFVERKLYCTAIDRQNDPYDSLPIFKDTPLRAMNKHLKAKNSAESDIIKGVLLNLYPDRHERKKNEKKFLSPPLAAKVLIKLIRDQVDEFREKNIIACLCEQWDSILMWSHYTKSHKGICVKYEVQKPTKNTAPKTPVRVNYTSSRTTLDTFDLMAFIKSPDTEDTSVKDKALRCLGALILEKSLDWEYEKEWRVVPHPKGQGYYTFENLVPVGVILGANVQGETRDLLTNVLPSHMSMTQVELDESKYKLNLIDI